MGGGGGAVFLQNVVNTKPLLFFRLKKLSSGVSKLRKTVSYKNRMRVRCLFRSAHPTAPALGNSG